MTKWSYDDFIPTFMFIIIDFYLYPNIQGTHPLQILSGIQKNRDSHQNPSESATRIYLLQYFLLNTSFTTTTSNKKMRDEDSNNDNIYQGDLLWDVKVEEIHGIQQDI